MAILKSKWISIEEYSSLISDIDSIGKTVYHSTDWLTAVARSFGCKLKFVMTCLDGEPLTVTPFLFKRKATFRLLGSPLRGTYTEFCGPVFFTNLENCTTDKIIESQHQFFARNFDYVEWRFKAEIGISASLDQSLESLGYEADHAPSLLVDLSKGEEDLWASFVGRARTAVRKAEKAGLSAEVIEPSQGWIKDYYDILTATFTKQGLAVPHPLCFFQEIENLSKLGYVFCVESRLDNRIGAAAIFVVGNGRMMYLSGVATNDALRLSATSLVQWHAMKRGISDGLTDYDMGGLGIASIDKFKRSFGGADVSHRRWVYRSRTFRLLEPLAIWLSKKGWVGLK